MDNIEADLLATSIIPAPPASSARIFMDASTRDLRFLVRPRGAVPEMSSPEEVAVINLDPDGAQEGIWYLSHLQQNC